ncbi:hypothetical protein ABEB36_004336 [Hypothenemus hampei]|uniref:Lipase n=1 Tax=Hypothenemus hampei TaxID=57062 RepID=A0ABD1F305_HYPHA
MSLKAFALSIVIFVIIYRWKFFVPKNYIEPKIGNITSFVESHGYTLEAHQVQTEDGYILTIHRIPGSPKSPPLKNKPVVFLMHGLLFSSIDWVILGPKKAVGFMLADAGYDVWLGNTRGNTYSRSHIKLDPQNDKEKFFNYSYHDIGVFDLPAAIDYVLGKTDQNKISYIGFSQGVTSFLVMGSLKPEYNDKILLMNAFAPVTDMYNITSEIFNVLNRFPQLFKIADLLGWYEILDVSTQPVFRMLCEFKPMCNLLFKICGMSEEQMPDKEFALKILSNFPAGMATKQAKHYAQGTATGLFAPFNENISAVTSHNIYDLSKVTVPIILYFGESDNVINHLRLTRDVASQLPNVKHIFKVPYTNFNHLDFLWGKDNRLLYDEVIRNIHKYNKQIKS